MTPAGIRVEALAKHYETPGGVLRALDGVSFSLKGGESLAITGPSGCGKSTLLGLIGGLDAPSAGHVFIADERVSALPEAERTRLRRRSLGLVFQSDNLLPFFTAVENVAFQLALNGAPDGYERCLELLAELGLEDDADRLPDQLSGGQRQRLAVGRALVHRPGVILADEPTGSLDADNSAAVVELLLAAQRDIGATLVVVTHDAAVAGRMGRVLRLQDGRLLDGTAEADDSRQGDIVA